MTRRDVDSLLRDWDRVARTARTPEPALKTGRVRARGNGLAALPLLVVAAVVVVGLAVFARSAGGPGVGATPGGSAAAIAPVTDSVDDGMLKLTLSADRGTYAEGEAIGAAATVEYIGQNAAIEIFTALDRIVFGVAEVGGDRGAGGGARQSCNPNTFTRAVPVSYPWTKNAGHVPGDPAFAFEEWYATSGPALRLPAGTWRLSATFEGAEGDCGGTSHTLTAEVVVTVGPATATSAGPTPGIVTAVPSATITPAPSAPYAGPSNVVTCGRLASIVCGRLLEMLAADHAAELAAAARIVVDDSCPPDSQCDRQYAFDAFVLVVPPAGIDEAVAYRATGNDGPDEVGTYTDALPAHLLAQASEPGVAPEPVRLDSGDPAPPPPATPPACMAALIDGTLAIDDRGSLGIQPLEPASVKVVRVQWPWGYTARVEPLGIALVDDFGQTIAHLGARLLVGGGMLTEGIWTACGDIQGIMSTTN